MSSSYDASHPFPLAEVPGWDFDADVVIVGYGSAGACAAIGAAEEGGRVVLFEVSSGSGGTSAMAGGDIYLGGGGGTSVQRKNGFQDSTEDFARYMTMAGGPDVDQERVRIYADNALDHFAWLQAQGVPYSDTYLPGKPVMPGTGDCLILSGSEEAWPFSEHAKPCPRGHLPKAIGEGGGRVLVDALASRAESLGVEAHFDARVVSLVVGAGAVHGIVVRIDGKDQFARARRGVILSTGGFVLNEEMLRQYAPQVARLGNDALSAGYDDGSGIRMGLSVGGAAIHMEEIFATLPFYPPESHIKGILVDERGQRFINEDAYPGRIAIHCMKQVGDRFFLLVDNEIFVQPSELSRIEIAAVGDSWEEIERQLGLVPGVLVSTVEVHNRYAASGEDPLFHKNAKWLKPLDTPPFAALACHFREAFYPYFTLGGLRTRPSGEVLTPDGQPVPGLYAAGRTACGLPRWGEGYSSGMSLGDCTFFGRLAGRTAARREVGSAHE